MRHIATIGSVVLVLGLTILATISFTRWLHKSQEVRCYDLQYLHVSGSVQSMRMTLTESEAATLHESVFEGVAVLMVSNGYVISRDDIRVVGATGIISLEPCR